ncbi:hypothetical protein [Sulfitobacter sp. SK011]|uniref:hypothetical protein n=1 Tax=Sulfitobacter sp. SK011 TaxID=1389004 RepID=UPI000E0AA505|nr:hypothetical protein [Sulfitobacter sp. SK011]AXI40768.1 hypothetical protein C1J02_01455 [Sulfitobacter sp. SK011]
MSSLSIRKTIKKLLTASFCIAFSTLAFLADAEARELSKFEVRRIQKILIHYGHEVEVTGVLDLDTSNAAKQLILEQFPGNESNIRILYELNTTFLRAQTDNDYFSYSLEPKSGSRGAIDYDKVSKARERYQRYLSSPAVIFTNVGLIGRGRTVEEATRDGCSKSNRPRRCKATHVLAPTRTGCIASFRYDPYRLSLTHTKSTNYGEIIYKGAKVIVSNKKPTVEEAKKVLCYNPVKIGCESHFELSCNF